MAWPASGQSRKCSIANGETIKVVSWNINSLPYQQRLAAGAFDAFVAVVRQLDADIFAFQEVTPAADELIELASALQGGDRCYHALVSAETNGEKYAVFYDVDAVDLLYPKRPAGSCDAAKPAGFRDTSPLMRSAPGSAGGGQRSQLSYFRVKGEGPSRDSRFDFALINVHVIARGSALDQLINDFDSLDQTYPWLADEQDRVLVGHLGVEATPARLRGNYFPQMKPLINPLLMISLGLSDMTFDEAVGRMSSSDQSRASAADSPSEHYDNILVRRWDRPGTCPSALYCGGLEEFIDARVYRHDKLLIDAADDFELTVSDHSPISARFCKYADTDPLTAVIF